MCDAVKFLDENTARLITSNQVIQGPYNVVKELVENALDAGATAIDIKLDNYGLDKISVKDNSKGITAADVAVMCKPGFSSKISDFSDLETLKTYGFRGEALASICCIAEVSITTKTDEDAVATLYKFNSNGEIIDKSPSHLNRGTLVTVQNIFYHQPVKRRLLLNAKASANTQGFSKCGTMSKIRAFLGAVGVAWPFVRIFLVHGGSLVWKKQGVSADAYPIKTALGETIGHNLVSNMSVIEIPMEDLGELIAVLPKAGATIGELSNTNKSAIILIINKRVVRHKKIEDILMEKFRQHFPDLGRSRYPTCVLELKVTQEDLDVNLEPDKSKFLMRREKEDKLLEFLRLALDDFYGAKNPDDGAQEEALVQDDIAPTAPNESHGVRSQEESMQEEVFQDYDMPPASKKLKLTESGDSTSLEQAKSPLLQQSVDSNQETVANPPTTQTNNSTHNSLQDSAEKSNLGGLKIDFFTPTLTVEDAPVILNGLNVEIMQQPREEQNQTIVNLSEPSSVDDSNPFIEPSQANSLLGTPDQSKNLENDFTFTEEDEEALKELEKLLSSSETSSDSNNSTQEVEPPVINQADWSRGHVVDENGSELVGACGVMVVPKAKTKHQKKIIEDNREQRLALLASPCTQMGLHNLRAFNMFCKETRPKLLKENANMGLCEVAPRLARLWKDLSDVEKERYDQVAQEYKMEKLNNESLLQPNSPLALQKKKEKKKPISEPPKANLCISLLKNAAEKSQSSQLVPDKPSPEASVSESPSIEIVSAPSNSQKSPQKTKKKKPMKIVEINLTLEGIMKKKTMRRSMRSAETMLFGKWNDSWLLRAGPEYLLMLPWTMQEALAFADMMSNCILPVKELDQPINLKENVVKTDSWKVLEQLTPESPISKCLVANGFTLKIKHEIGSVCITHITDTVSNYGIEDLMEILEHLAKNDCDLVCFRPTKVINFFKAKCKEHVAKLGERKEFASLMLAFMEKCDLEGTCPHGNPFNTKLPIATCKNSQGSQY